MLKTYCVLIYLLVPNLCKRMCPLCTKELYLLSAFDVGIGASLLTNNIQQIFNKNNISMKKNKMKKS